MPRRSDTTAAGFTLLEAMVALVIVALGMMAVTTQLNRYALTAAYMEEKTLASWIGANRVVELSVAGEWPEIGSDEDELEYAGRQWLLRTEVSETVVENLRRVDVEVSLATTPDRVVHTVSGLLEPPAPRGFLPLQWLGTFGGAEGAEG